METTSTGYPITVSWWAIHNYQEALNPYIKMGRGTVNKGNVWWDPSDPDRNVPAMWGSFTDNGLLTGVLRTLASVGSPASTVLSTLRQREWSRAVGVPVPVPLPVNDPADPFWVSEFFDMCLDPWADTNDSGHPYHWTKGMASPPCSLFPEDAYCTDWNAQIDGEWNENLDGLPRRQTNRQRYNNNVVFGYLDGHVKTGRFNATYRSAMDNDWDLQ